MTEEFRKEILDRIKKEFGEKKFPSSTWFLVGTAIDNATNEIIKKVNITIRDAKRQMLQLHDDNGDYDTETIEATFEGIDYLMPDFFKDVETVELDRKLKKLQEVLQ